MLVERRSAHPLVPPALFANTTFSAANAATLLVYGALGVVSLLLVLQLQVVAGFTPLAAGTALLPVTAIMLVFSARAGALAGRIGPRLPMTLGPLVSAAGLLLLLRVDTTTSWLVDVLPGVTVFGAGLTLTVAPLTSTVLDATPDRFAGAASGVNNAVARAAGLLAVAVVPGLAGRCAFLFGFLGQLIADSEHRREQVQVIADRTLDRLAAHADCVAPAQRPDAADRLPRRFRRPGHHGRSAFAARRFAAPYSA